MSALRKTGVNLLHKMEDEWTYLETELELEPIGACGDASGDERKMRSELLKVKPHALLADCWSHQVRLYSHVWQDCLPESACRYL
jgi:hypothetical protein